MVERVVPTLQRFIMSLDQRLQELSASEIRSALLTHAQALASDERDAFLGIFTEPSPAGHDEKAPDTTWPVGDDPLLHDIDAFVGRVASGKYFEGFGWDEEIHDQRSFGDESWASEMDDLFGGAQDAFLAGELGLSRAAYQRLLEAFGLDQEVGTFCGPDAAVEMVETDIVEAESRYLRAVYETTSPAERAAALVGEWFGLPTWASVPSLAMVRETRRQDLPDLEAFLPEWITQLRSIGGRAPQARRLLAEAAELHGGVDELALLARDSATDQARHYLDWVEALRRTGRDPDAAAAAREALQTLDPYGETRARIAEHLAESMTGDAGEILAAQRAAWRAAPTQERLLRLHHAATVTGQVPQAMAAEAEALETGEGPDRANGWLRAALFLLAGRFDDAVRLLDSPPESNPQRGASRVLVPYLLAAGCAGPTRPEWTSTRVGRLLRSVDHPESWNWTDLYRLDTNDRTGDEIRPLSELLTEQLAAAADDPALRLQCLETALSEVDRQVDTVVSGQFRGGYAEAARLVACCAEAVTLEEGEEAGTFLVAQRRDRYPRHAAFRRELDAAVRQTPLVTAPPTRGRR